MQCGAVRWYGDGDGDDGGGGAGGRWWGVGISGSNLCLAAQNASLVEQLPGTCTGHSPPDCVDLCVGACLCQSPRACLFAYLCVGV